MCVSGILGLLCPLQVTAAPRTFRSVCWALKSLPRRWPAGEGAAIPEKSAHMTSAEVRPG